MDKYGRARHATDDNMERFKGRITKATHTFRLCKFLFSTVKNGFANAPHSYVICTYIHKLSVLYLFVLRLVFCWFIWAMKNHFRDSSVRKALANNKLRVQEKSYVIKYVDWNCL